MPHTVRIEVCGRASEPRVRVEDAVTGRDLTYAVREVTLNVVIGEPPTVTLTLLYPQVYASADLSRPSMAEADELARATRSNA